MIKESFPEKLATIQNSRKSFLLRISIILLCILLGLLTGFAFPASDVDKAEKDHYVRSARCTTAVIGEEEKAEEIIDETDKTVAIPWVYPGVPLPVTGAPVSPRTSDPAWTLLDSTSTYQRLKESEHLAIEFDHTSNMLVTLPPGDPLTAKAHQAVNKAPTWLQKELEDTFSRLNSTDQDILADAILNANDPYVDEIAWSVAHISTSDLTNASFYTQLITENAEFLYAVDADVDYVEIVDYGNSVEGGDYYSTERYQVDEDGTINEYEYPRDIYYWYVVHPRGSDEIPTYIDPDAPCSSSGTPAAPPQGVFWRKYFYGCDSDNDGTIDSACPTYFGQCDNDHDGTKDGPCPVLRDMLQQVHVLWAGLKDTPGPQNGALGQTSDWVHRILGKWGDVDGCRPIQPVTIYYWQDGNCGEFGDMQMAAGRTALIPTIVLDAAANDHCWNEFYERRWIEWQAEDKQIDHPEGHDGWAGGLAVVHGWRGDGYGLTDHTANYTPTAQLVVTITDANGYPVDGARVDLASDFHSLLCDIHFAWSISRGHTDDQGQITFIIGDSNEPDCRRYYVRVHTDWADYPSSGWALVVDSPLPDTTYYWSHQFTEGSVPRLSISTATEPSDPTIDHLMEVTYSVTDEYLFGDGYSTGIIYRQDMQPGNLDFFVADSSNYSLFTSDSPFEAYRIAFDSSSGDISFIPPATDDWYAVWSNKATLNLSQVVDATVRLYENNGYIPPVCQLMVDKGSSNEAILDWEDLSGVNVEAYNVYRSTNPADVGKDKTKDQLSPFLIATVIESTYTDPDDPPPDSYFNYSVRTLGKDGNIAEECSY